LLAIAALVVVAGSGFLVGHLSAPAPPNRAAGDYFDGLRVGEAQGRQEGRALQEGVALPARERRTARLAFDAGYVAGANDVFAGYDGGWSLRVPWIVTLEGGSGKIVYRIRDRTRVEPGVKYYLCPDGHSLCHRS
jgi:hypothetical protein